MGPRSTVAERVPAAVVGLFGQRHRRLRDTRVRRQLGTPLPGALPLAMYRVAEAVVMLRRAAAEARTNRVITLGRRAFSKFSKSMGS